MAIQTKSPPDKMSVAEFQRWYESQPDAPRFELYDGVVVAMSPERIHHAKVKHKIARALEDAIEKAGLGCHVLPDGLTVIVDDANAYEPDALVYCGEEIDGHETQIPNPLILVEVLSPSTKATDLGDKFTGYFSLESVQHYLIIDPEKHLIFHHQKTGKNKILTTIVTEGSFELDPPNIILHYHDIF